MIEFCCCTLRTKSYYLLMIFISVVCIGGPVLEEVRAVGQKQKLSPLLYTFAILISLLFCFYYIVSIVAFFKFVIDDSIQTKFSKFYAQTMFISTCVMFGFQAIFFIIALAHGLAMNRKVFMIIFGTCISMVLNVFLFFWSRTLLENMPEVKKEDVAEEMEVTTKLDNQAENKNAEEMNVPKEKTPEVAQEADPSPEPANEADPTEN